MTYFLSSQLPEPGERVASRRPAVGMSNTWNASRRPPGKQRCWPPSGEESLENYTTSSLTQLRQLLRVLQAGDLSSQPVGTNDFRPQPGLANLTGLLTSFQDTGMPVSVHIEGATRGLEPSVDLAAYRIVQEGLTNILKHAGKDSDPRLCLVWGLQSLLIQINNDTSSAEAHRGLALSIGRGLVGLREQAHAVGGCLHTEHHNGSYRLTATLPLADSAQQRLIDNHG